MDAKKALRRQNLFRTLKTIAYLLGYPLMLILLQQSSYALGFGVKGTNVEYMVIAWAAVTAVQILVTIITKSYSARSVSVVIVTVILLLGFSFVFDMKAEAKLNEVAENMTRDYYRLEANDKVTITAKNDVLVAEIVYADDDKEKVTYETPIKSYNEHLSEFKPWSGGSGLSGSINSLRGRFSGTYNIGGGGNKNTDGTRGGAAPSINGNDPEIWFGETGGVYNPNGLYADSYTFTVDSAIEIILTIYRTQDDYKAMGKDADEELAKAYAAVEASAEWNDYKNSEEYQAAYGEGGTMSKYAFTEERLDSFLAALGRGLGGLELVNSIFSLLDTFGVSLPVTIEDVRNLSVQSVCDLIDGMGLDLAGIAGSLGVVVAEGTPTKDVLLKLASTVYYTQAPTVLPSMYFIEDETLRTYAYAKYYAQVHGARNACVLYAEEGGNIGGITMSSSGVSASAAFTAEEMCTIRAISSYSGTMFPLLLLRRFAMYFAAFTALAYLLAYFFAYKQHMYASIIKDGIYDKR